MRMGKDKRGNLRVALRKSSATTTEQCSRQKRVMLGCSTFTNQSRHKHNVNMHTRSQHGVPPENPTRHSGRAQTARQLKPAGEGEQLHPPPHFHEFLTPRRS